MGKNCKICKLVLMRPHRELMFWYQCSSCGYTEFDINLIHPTKQDMARKNRMARYDCLEPVAVSTLDPLPNEEGKDTDPDSSKD